jgi:hypothetical protein
MFLGDIFGNTVTCAENVGAVCGCHIQHFYSPCGDSFFIVIYKKNLHPSFRRELQFFYAIFHTLLQQDYCIFIGMPSVKTHIVNDTGKMTA